MRELSRLPLRVLARADGAEVQPRTERAGHVEAAHGEPFGQDGAGDFFGDAALKGFVVYPARKSGGGSLRLLPPLRRIVVLTRQAVLAVARVLHPALAQRRRRQHLDALVSLAELLRPQR